MEAIKEKFLKLSKSKRIQFVAASVLSLFLSVGVSVYAWFALSGNLETLTKVKEPENMDIRAGGGIGTASPDPIVNFDLSDIDIVSISEGKPELRVFTVSPGDYKIKYKLQLAHTTNVPFSYKIYYAAAGTASDNDVAYSRLSGTGDTYYYKKGDEISLTTRNPAPDPDDPNNPAKNGVAYYGRELAEADTNNYYYKNTYNVETDEPEIYAIPVYMQSGTIPEAGKNMSSDNSYDYYILEIDWDEESAATHFSEWNEAINKKETDMIYITASRSS